MMPEDCRVAEMALGQVQKRVLSSPGVFLGRMAAWPNEALPVEWLFGLLLALVASEGRCDYSIVTASVVVALEYDKVTQETGVSNKRPLLQAGALPTLG